MTRTYHSGKTIARGTTKIGVYYGSPEPNKTGMNRIKEIREAQGLTQAELGELMGTTDATVQRLETGKRKLTEEWLRKIAVSLAVSPAELLGDIIQTTTQGIEVKGEVWAGVWRESFEDEDKYSPLPIGRDPRYPHADQYALKVKGNSMDKVFPEGQYIVCAAWADIGREVQHNDLLVVHRHRAGATESTVKRAKKLNGKVLLYPESTDPKWQLPVSYGGENDPDDIEVVVTALVIGRYEPL